MSQAYIEPESIERINQQIQDYKELVEEQLSKLIAGFEELNWNTESGNSFRENTLETLESELKNIL